VTDDVVALAIGRAEAIAALPPGGVRTAVRWARHEPLDWHAQLRRERELLRATLLRD
jgi:hypothetical protein